MKLRKYLKKIRRPRGFVSGTRKNMTQEMLLDLIFWMELTKIVVLGIFLRICLRLWLSPT